MTATAYPLQWPAGTARTAVRRTPKYKVTPSVALDELLAGLRLLGATNVVVSSNAPVRRDGRPYSEALSERHGDPGVAVYFTFEKQQVVIACDAWSALWQNIRAVGLTIEGMRQIQRSGATDLLQRAFTGFKALAGPQHWSEVLGIGPVAANHGLTVETIDAAYRALAHLRHPDRGGTHDAMAALNVARDQAIAEIEGHAR